MANLNKIYQPRIKLPGECISDFKFIHDSENSIFSNIYFQIGPEVTLYAKNVCQLYRKMHLSAKAIDATY